MFAAVCPCGQCYRFADRLAWLSHRPSRRVLSATVKRPVPDRSSRLSRDLRRASVVKRERSDARRREQKTAPISVARSQHPTDPIKCQTSTKKTQAGEVCGRRDDRRLLLYRVVINARLVPEWARQNLHSAPVGTDDFSFGARPREADSLSARGGLRIQPFVHSRNLILIDLRGECAS